MAISRWFEVDRVVQFIIAQLQARCLNTLNHLILLLKQFSHNYGGGSNIASDTHFTMSNTVVESKNATRGGGITNLTSLATYVIKKSIIQ